MKPVPSVVFDQKTEPFLHRGVALQQIADLFYGTSNTQRFQPGQSIVVEGDPIRHLFQVVAGTVRCCSYTAEGRRQIFRFARSGDFLGFVDPEFWHLSAEAVDCVVLRLVPVASFEAALEQSEAMRRDLRNHVANILAERERQMTVLAFEPATRRLLWFLEDFKKQSQISGYSSLPMTRQEIGDFLGLSLETVSRSFSALRKAGLIEMKGAEQFRLVSDTPSVAA